MNLNESLDILLANNYEIIDESRFGKALGIGALALASLFGKAHAEIDNLDLKTADSSEIEEIKNTLEQESDIDYCKLKSKSLVCKDTNNTISFYPTESLENIGISDDITEIIFLDGYESKID